MSSRFFNMSVMRDKRRSLDGTGLRIQVGGEEVLLEQKPNINTVSEGLNLGFKLSTGTFIAGNPTFGDREIEIGFYRNGIRLRKTNTGEEWREKITLNGAKTCLKLTNTRNLGNYKVSIFLPADADHSQNGAGIAKIAEKLGVLPNGYAAGEETTVDVGGHLNEALQVCQVPTAPVGGIAPIVWTAG